MISVVANILTYLLAVYGAFTIITGILNSIWVKKEGSGCGMRLILLTKNQESTIEGVIRNIFSKHLIDMVTPDRNITILDMGSTDETLEVLEKMEEDFSMIQVLKLEDKEKIFDEF